VLLLASAMRDLQIGYMCERYVPAFFRFGRDKAILRFRGFVLPFNPISFVSRLLQRQLHNALFLIFHILILIPCILRPLDANRPNSFEHFRHDSLNTARWVSASLTKPLQIEVPWTLFHSRIPRIVAW